MKHIFMSFALFVLTGPLQTNPAQAEQPDGNTRCLEMYQSYLNNNAAVRLKPEDLLQNYVNMCLPKSAHRDNPMYLKLLQIMDDDRPVTTIQAKLFQPQAVRTV